MVEMCIRGIKGANRCFVVAIHVGVLARDAVPCSLANIILQTISSKAFHDKANGGFGLDGLDLLKCRIFFFGG